MFSPHEYLRDTHILPSFLSSAEGRKGGRHYCVWSHILSSCRFHLVGVEQGRTGQKKRNCTSSATGSLSVVWLPDRQTGRHSLTQLAPQTDVAGMNEEKGEKVRKDAGKVKGGKR